MTNSIKIILFFLTVFFFKNSLSAQSIKPIYDGSELRYTIVNGKLKTCDKKQKNRAKSSMSNILYALDEYFESKKYRIKNEMEVKQNNIRFQIENSDTLETTIYVITFKKPLFEKKTDEYPKLHFPPSIVPQDDYLIFKNDYSLVVVSVFFYKALTEDNEDYTRKKKNLHSILSWLKTNYN